MTNLSIRHVVGSVLEKEALLGLACLKPLFYRPGHRDPEKLSDSVIAVEVVRGKAESRTQKLQLLACALSMAA